MSDTTQRFSASLAKDSVYTPGLRSFMEYRDPEDFDHLFGALRLAGLE